MKILANKEREDIFKLFTTNTSFQFNEIEKATNIPSNKLSYHLNELLKQGLLEKDENVYKVTKSAQSLLPKLTQITGKEEGPLTVVISAITKDNKILLIQRKKRPYKGYWSLTGGKMKLSESIEEGALREAKEETGLDLEFKGVKGVVHERVKEDNVYKHGFVFFFTHIEAKNTDLTHTEEGQLEWFDLNNLENRQLIPSDKWMIENFLINKKSGTHSVIMDEKDEKLISLHTEEHNI